VARRNLDLVAVSVAAVAGAGVSPVTSLPAAAALVPGVLLALVAPGYAVAAALMPRPSVDRSERAMLVAGCGLATLVLTSILIAGAGIRLDLASWAVALLVVTLSCCGVAALRRRRAAVSWTALRLPTVSRGTWLAVISVAAMILGATAIARIPAGNVTGYSSLWIDPTAGDEGAFSVGVRSNETAVTSYIVTARTGGRVVLTRKLTLRPGQSWTGSASVGAVTAGFARTVRVRLVDEDDPAKVYRHVDFTFGSGF
jgi:uncharacterized membrane protein